MLRFPEPPRNAPRRDGAKEEALNCANLPANKAACNCSYEPCPRKGNCCACVAYHRASGELPACYFDAAGERSYDRSVENYLRRRR